MRSPSLRSTLLTGCLVASTGCGARVAEATDAGADALVLDDAPLFLDSAASDTLPTDASAKSDASIDFGPVDVGPTEPPDPAPAIDCFGDVGPTDPKSVRDATYQRDECGISSCLEVFAFDPSTCKMTLTALGRPPQERTLAPTDCVALARWLGSAAFQKGQKEGTGCSGLGPRYESTELHLWPDEWLGRKSFYCPVEPFVSHRACYVKIKDRYFRPKF